MNIVFVAFSMIAAQFQQSLFFESILKDLFLYNKLDEKKRKRGGVSPVKPNKVKGMSFLTAV